MIIFVTAHYLAMRANRESMEEFQRMLSAAAAKLGFSSLREKQKEIVTAFAKGNDVFVSLPTGSGKSLCFYILPWLFDDLRKNPKPTSIIIILSPLLALMKTQVSLLNAKGLNSIYVTQDDVEDHVFQRLQEGDYQVVLFSPEALLCSDTWRDMLQSPVYQDNVVAVVIDEAHLVKKW